MGSNSLYKQYLILVRIAKFQCYFRISHPLCFISCSLSAILSKSLILAKRVSVEELSVDGCSSSVQLKGNRQDLPSGRRPTRCGCRPPIISSISISCPQCG